MAVFTAHFSPVDFAAPPLDHMFAHRQRKPARRGDFPLLAGQSVWSAGLSAPSFSCLEGGHRSLFRLLLLLRDLRLGDAEVYLHRRPLPHLIRDMGVGVQRGGAGYMAQDGGQGLHIHSVGQSVGCECMPQIMEPDPLAPGMVQELSLIHI